MFKKLWNDSPLSDPLNVLQMKCVTQVSISHTGLFESPPPFRKTGFSGWRRNRSASGVHMTLHLIAYCERKRGILNVFCEGSARSMQGEFISFDSFLFLCMCMCVLFITPLLLCIYVYILIFLCV